MTTFAKRFILQATVLAALLVAIACAGEGVTTTVAPDTLLVSPEELVGEYELTHSSQYHGGIPVRLPSRWNERVSADILEGSLSLRSDGRYVRIQEMLVQFATIPPHLTTSVDSGQWTLDYGNTGCECE